MTTIDDLVFCSYFKTFNATNNKVDNCAHVSMAIFPVNLSVLFCLRIKKSLNIKKLIAMQMFSHLHANHEVCCSRSKNSATRSLVIASKNFSFFMHFSNKKNLFGKYKKNENAFFGKIHRK